MPAVVVVVFCCWCAGGRAHAFFKNLWRVVRADFDWGGGWADVKCKNNNAAGKDNRGGCRYSW